MSNKYSFHEPPEENPPYKNGNSIRLNKPVALGILTFTLLILLFGLLISQRYEILLETKNREAYNIADNAKNKIQESLAHSLSATKTLSFFIDNNGNVNDFDSIASIIMESGNDIDALQLVPHGVIRYVYPLQGNERVIGYDILNDPARSKEAYKAIERKQMFFAGPFELRQGGMGVVGRLPVFRKGEFWGFSAVVIKMSTLFKNAGIDSLSSSGYYFQLSKINPDTKKEEYFLPVQEINSKKRSVFVKVPDGEWKLSVISKNIYKGFGDIFLLGLAGFILSLTGGIIIYRFAIRPKKLKELVKARTSELKSSENKYRSLIERVSDAFVSLDNDWNYTYLNKKAGEILNRDSDSLIGKNIWKEFPIAIGKPFYHACYRAMETQEYQYLEDYYFPLDKWLENHIYPSSDGLTVFYKDVTEIKQVSLALKNNEEKYRSLIEQASDGIVITDLEGKILEVNNSIMQMAGYEESEMIGHHLSEFLPENDLNTNPLRINELMRGKSLLYERSILKKDGITLDVEVNSRMASSHTLIGFVRDISERKKVEKVLQYQSRLIEGVTDAITSLDMERRIVTWNRACQELYGLTTEAVIGKRIPELMSFDFPGSSPEEVFKQVYSQGYWKGEFDFIHPVTKLKINLLSSLSLLRDANNNITGFIIISKDITERKTVEDKLVEKEKRLQQVLASTADNFYVVDTDYNVVIINKVAERNLEIAWGKPVTIGTNLLDVIPGNGEEPIKENFERAFTGEGIEYEMHLFHPDLPTWVLIQFSPVIDESATVTGVSVIAKDITERKKNEELLKESEERYRTLVENAPEALVVFDVKKKMFVSVSESATRLFGMSKEELLQIGPVDVSPEYQPDGRTSAEAAQFYIHKAINGEKSFFEWMHCKKTGELIPCEIWLVRLPAENEVLVRGSIVDITERKKAEEEVLKSKKQFQNLVENISGVYWVNDLETYQTLYISPSYETIWGLKCEDLYKNPADFINSVHPDDKVFLEEAHKNIANTRKANLTYRIIKPGGDVRWISANINVVLDSKGNKIEYGYAEDITERKKAEEELQYSEQKYRLLFYNNPLPMWMTTLPGLDIIDVNEAAIRQYGYSREEFLKLNTRSLRPTEDVEGFLNEVDKMLPGTINVRAWRHKKKDGTIIHVETYSHQVMYEGRLVWLGLSHDVTEQYNAKELLQKSYEDIRQLASNLQSIREDERTNIAREIHDELGQQLTGLKMDMHWLTRKINPADTEVSKKMQDSIALINSTITTVRKIATDLRPSILDDLGLLAALEWQSEEFERRSGTKVVFNNYAGEIAVVPEAATALFRIYQELLTNIARHANATMVTASLEKDDKSLYFSIKDDGIGFSLNTISEKKTLGLLGVSERTTLIGGKYEVISKPGSGSEIIISVPLNLVTNTL